MLEGSDFQLTRQELFEGAERIEFMSYYDEACNRGLMELYNGKGVSERWIRPDGSEFTWESEISGFTQVAEVTLYLEGVAKYRMVTYADSTGWHDADWQKIDLADEEKHHHE